MRAFLFAAAALAIVSFSMPAAADQIRYCEGFEMGYLTVKGNHARVPRCPREPRIPRHSTAYQEGLKAGMAAASR